MAGCGPPHHTVGVARPHGEDPQTLHRKPVNVSGHGTRCDGAGSIQNGGVYTATISAMTQAILSGAPSA
jgi:hypothetical protein